MTDTAKQAAASVENTAEKDFSALKAWVVKHVLENGEHLFSQVMKEAHNLTGAGKKAAAASTATVSTPSTNTSGTASASAASTPSPAAASAVSGEATVSTANSANPPAGVSPSAAASS